MSQREFMIILAHAHVCGGCRDKLLADPAATTIGRALSADEKWTLGNLKFEDFITPDTLARATGVTVGALDAYRDEPVVRLRHL